MEVCEKYSRHRKPPYTAAAAIGAKASIFLGATVGSNDEIERRGASPASNEGTLSQSSTSPLADEDPTPRSLQPIVRSQLAIAEELLLSIEKAARHAKREAVLDPNSRDHNRTA